MIVAHCIIQAGADGIIVVSAFVSIIAKKQRSADILLEELVEMAHELKAVTRSVNC